MGVFMPLGVANPVPSLNAPTVPHQSQQSIWGRPDAREKEMAGVEWPSVAGLFLCLHGHQIGANVQKSVQEITGRHAAQGVSVDDTLFGHLHATSIGDYHARNASLVGSNAYPEAGLNYCSKAYSEDWADMEAQLKARQTYEQTTGLARWRHGAAFWDLRGEKG